MLQRFLTNYIQRHTHPLNRLLHLVGVPLTFVVTAVLVSRQQEPWWWAVASFVGGYALQFLGHAIEGNDAGEVVLVKMAGAALPRVRSRPGAGRFGSGRRRRSGLMGSA